MTFFLNTQGYHLYPAVRAASATCVPYSDGRFQAQPGPQISDLWICRPGFCPSWGDAGILSLGQGIFFGLGGYFMAMFLNLEASTPEATKIQSTPGIPDFMDWNQITACPGSGSRSTA
jgi:hypothetical protein